MEYGLLSVILTFIVAGAGAYFGAYLKRKGEDLATHEDLTKLIDQVSAVTKTTKEIEAKFSNEVWDRQKQWEVKKEAIFDVLRALGSLHSSLGTLHSAYKATTAAMVYDAETRIETYDKHKKRFEDFTRASVVAGVACGADISRQLAELELIATHLVHEATRNNFAGSSAKLEEFTNRVHDVQMAIRVDLGIGPP